MKARRSFEAGRRAGQVYVTNVVRCGFEDVRARRFNPYPRRRHDTALNKGVRRGIVETTRRWW